MKISTGLIALSLGLAATSTPVVIDSSPVTLPFVRRFNYTGGGHEILRRDQARARSLKERAYALRDQGFIRRAVVNEAVTNQVDTYVAAVGVGTPPTTYNLIIDTGSSNTWVGAGTAYKKTSSSVSTSDSVSVSYGSGSFSGKEFRDTVTLGNLVIKSQSIGVASSASGFDGVDGILGIGPVDLTQGTLSPDSSSSIPTVTDNAFSQGLIDSNLVAVSFNPTTSESSTNGELTWGGTDSSKFTGSITNIPLTSTYPASAYWGIDQTVTYGSSKSNILSETAGIVDTGTTLILLATDAYNRYLSASKATLDSTTGLLRVTTSQFSKLQSLFFTAGGTTFEITANAQAWPRSLNSAIGGTSSNVYLIVADLGSNSGEGLDFINGYAFLERYYSVFDTGSGSVGLAETPNTFSTSN